MSDIVNPFEKYLPKARKALEPETPATMEDVTEKALDLVKSVAWANESPDGAPTYVQNRMVFAQATTAVGAVCDIEDADSVRKCISAYFEMCKLNSTDPTLPGMANALGMSARKLKSLRDVGSEFFFTQKPLMPDVKDAIFQAFRVLEQMYAQAVFDGRLSPAAATLLGASHFDYATKVEHKVETTHHMAAPKTAEEIQKELESLPILNVECEDVTEE